MVYHVPCMLEKYGNLRQFSGQGILQLRVIGIGMYITILYVLYRS